jgi:hypothetical protein
VIGRQTALTGRGRGASRRREARMLVRKPTRPMIIMTPAHMISAIDGACAAMKATVTAALNALAIRPYGTSDLSV